MKPRHVLEQAELHLGGELVDSHDLIFDFYPSAAGSALEPVLIEDCEAAFPALVLP